jgi:hypothetical protein
VRVDLWKRCGRRKLDARFRAGVCNRRHGNQIEPVGQRLVVEPFDVYEYIT